MVGQRFVVEPQKFQNSRMVIGSLGAVFYGSIAEIICCTVCLSAFDSAPRHPHAESVGMVVTPFTTLLDIFPT